MGLIQSKAKALDNPYPPEPLAPMDPYGFDDAPAPVPPAAKAKTPGHAFSAELDVAELDDRYRPGLPWAARSMLLSRNNLVILSRRMSYKDRIILIAVHLVDSEPTPLLGKVRECEYHADAMYRITLDLLPIKQPDVINAWLQSLNNKR